MFHCIHDQVLNDDGRTTSTREKILTITVKRGWSEGTKVSFEKEGDQGPNRIPGAVGARSMWIGRCDTVFFFPADIIFEVKDKVHPLFKRDGTDLVFDSTISLLVVRSCLQNSGHTWDPYFT